MPLFLPPPHLPKNFQLFESHIRGLYSDPSLVVQHLVTSWGEFEACCHLLHDSVILLRVVNIHVSLCRPTSSLASECMSDLKTSRPHCDLLGPGHHQITSASFCPCPLQGISHTAAGVEPSHSSGHRGKARVFAAAHRPCGLCLPLLVPRAELGPLRPPHSPSTEPPSRASSPLSLHWPALCRSLAGLPTEVCCRSSSHVCEAF